MYASSSSYPSAFSSFFFKESETKEYLVKKRVKRCFFIAYGFFTGADPIVNGWSGNRLDIDYFNLNLTISDNGNGKEYKESFISMRMAGTRS
jgi:hypothetical protein